MSLESEELQSEEHDDSEGSQSDNRISLEQMYQAAKDEAELLEFKNYELMFKIQELELNQKRILNSIGVGVGVGQTTLGDRPPDIVSENNNKRQQVSLHTCVN